MKMCVVVNTRVAWCDRNVMKCVVSQDQDRVSDPYLHVTNQFVSGLGSSTVLVLKYIFIST